MPESSSLNLESNFKYEKTTCCLPSCSQNRLNRNWKPRKATCMSIFLIWTWVHSFLDIVLPMLSVFVFFVYGNISNLTLSLIYSKNKTHWKCVFKWKNKNIIFQRDVLSQLVLKNNKSELHILFCEDILNISYISQSIEK